MKYLKDETYLIRIKEPTASTICLFKNFEPDNNDWIFVDYVGRTGVDNCFAVDKGEYRLATRMEIFNFVPNHFVKISSQTLAIGDILMDGKTPRLVKKIHYRGGFISNVDVYNLCPVSLKLQSEARWSYSGALKSWRFADSDEFWKYLKAFEKYKAVNYGVQKALDARRIGPLMIQKFIRKLKTASSSDFTISDYSSVSTGDYEDAPEDAFRTHVLSENPAGGYREDGWTHDNSIKRRQYAKAFELEQAKRRAQAEIDTSKASDLIHSFDARARCGTTEGTRFKPSLFSSGLDPFDEDPEPIGIIYSKARRSGQVWSGLKYWTNKLFPSLPFVPSPDGEFFNSPKKLPLFENKKKTQISGLRQLNIDHKKSI